MGGVSGLPPVLVHTLPTPFLSLDNKILTGCRSSLSLHGYVVETAGLEPATSCL